MLKLERQLSVVLVSEAVRVVAALRDWFGSETPRVVSGRHWQIVQAWALRICDTTVLLLGSLLAAIIAMWLLVAAGIWALVILITWRQMFGTTFG